ncbi:MAG: DUF116 domain-containing protein [Clostridia bacterium]|nr:DUF116 domain-containing protein [Clostridia bacterium]
MTIIILLFFISVILAVYFAYRRKKVSRKAVWLVRTGMYLLFPVIVGLAGLFKTSKDTVRHFYITINNILVQSGGIRFYPEEILAILPHCLQNSNCGYKITHHIENCKKCGKCPIGDIVKLMEEKGVSLHIVTGGTAARKVVKESRPKLILSVACERDLASGILDVRHIPVIGVLNDRPNGPCLNTLVDVEAIAKILDKVIKIK